MPFLPILTPFLALCLALTVTADAADDAIYLAAADRIERSYLHLDEFDTALAFRGAGDAAQSVLPWLLVDRQASQDRVDLRLSHGDTGVFATVAFPVDGPLSDLPRALGAIEDAVRARAARGSDASLPPDLDLPVELLRGVSRALDIHSVVLSGDRLDEFNERIRGRVVGIGCAFSRETAGLSVSKVFPDSPAALGGLRVGDMVRRVDGVSTLGMEYDDLVDRVRGDLGTTVRVQIERVDGATGQPRQISLVFTRAEVRIPNVEWGRTPAGSGWIRVDHFSQQTYKLMERALTDLSAEPAVDGVILDLRGNAGGSMIQAAKTVDLFVDSGLILRTGGRDFEKVPGLIRQVQAWPGEPGRASASAASHAPLVVLMDRGSASASEIVAGSLALLERAVLIGEHSHGKGTVQQPFELRQPSPLKNEVKLKLTIAEYHLAQDTAVPHGIGLRPDLATNRVELSQSGAVLPRDVARGDALGLVTERPGWRRFGTPPERGDVAMTLAEDVLHATTGPSRAELLQAGSTVLASWRQTETHRLVEAMAARGIDWSGDDLCSEPCQTPNLGVTIELNGEPRSGQPVTVRARVHNQGSAPLHRLVVRLSAASSRLPWDGLTLPIGFIPPGETATGSATVVLPVFPASREDLVAVTADADRRPSVGAEPDLLRIVAPTAPPVSISVRGVTTDESLGDANADEDALVSTEARAVEVVVSNDGEIDLSGVQVRLTQPDDPHLEPLERQVLVDALPAGQSKTVLLHLAWTGDRPPWGAPRVPVEVAAERFPSLLNAVVPIAWDGGVFVAVPPRLDADIPIETTVGTLPVHLVATDDQGIASVSAWWRGRQLAWRSGQGPDLALDLNLDVQPGTHTLVAAVTDNDGVTTRRRWVIYASADGDGVAIP